MNSGMLWFDNSKTGIESKVTAAAEYYKRKFGAAPTTCLVNPAVIEKPMQVGSIRVEAYRAVLPGHLWIGVDDGG